MKIDLPDELRAVLDAHDGRTLIEMREAEPSYDVVIDKATAGNGGTSITFNDGMGTLLTGPLCKVGDTVTIWDGHAKPYLGGTRHGWALNGVLIEWKTPFERIAERVQGLAAHDRSQRERLERRAKLDRRVRADLWSAVWEATQTMSYDQIRETVEATLREVETDAP